MSNLLSYPLVEDNDDILFTTENGSIYSVYFTDGSNYLPDASFSTFVLMFGFERKHRVRSRSGFDPRILPTVVKVLYLAFQKQPDLIVVYVCSQANGLQQVRNTLFEKLYQQFKAGYRKLDYNDGESFFSSAIFREANPYAEELEERIQTFIRDK
ncbi:hypothetical protein [Larkinella rosea]|uniref:hypothetical protein n=1 Tax=Larkinella rosea TaxID=2025312 RepID=UPI000F5D663D|nr:hypothetical protein [Larkinella rosea]